MSRVFRPRSKRVLAVSLFITLLAQYVPPAGQRPPSGNPPKTAFGEEGENQADSRVAEVMDGIDDRGFGMVAQPKLVEAIAFSRPYA